jgi:outer membrane protein OmpA-like peptidoglycan-associated protein
MQPYFVFGEVVQTDTGLKVTMDSDLLFKVGHSHLSKDGIQKIDDLAVVLLKHPNNQVNLTVYTDNSGSDSGDLRISKRRAKAIEAELVRQGYSAANLTAVGKGSADPVAANDTPENQAKNRRVEIVIPAP